MASSLVNSFRRHCSFLAARPAIAAAPFGFQAALFSTPSVGSGLDLAAPTSLQRARTWDEGMASHFATSSLSDVFMGKKVVIFGVPGAFTGVCTKAHVPSYVQQLEAFKAKGVDSVICTAVNDPYTLHAWAHSMAAANKLEFMADFDGSFHKLLGLDLDLSAALLGFRSQRWAAVVDNGVIKALEVEKTPSDMDLSAADNILKHL